MSAISTDINKIRNAVWADEVRESIAHGIEQCYSDVSNPTLQTDALEAALQAKIDEGEMAALTIGDGTITTAKIANGAITQAKLDPNISFEADGELDATSTNAIQNKVVAQAIGEVNESLGEQEETITALVDKMCLFLRTLVYDSEKLPDPETEIKKFRYDVLGIYKLSSPITFDADSLIETTLEVESSDDVLYKNDWHILVEMTATATADIFGCDVWKFYQQYATTVTLVVPTSGGPFEAKIQAQALNVPHRYVIAYDSTTRKLTIHGNNNGVLQSSIANASIGSNWGPINLGGSISASMKGTISKFNALLGSITEAQIKAFLEVE